MDVLEASILDFFSVPENFTCLKNLMTNKHVQPRLIDYYVTQYSKNNPEFFVNTESVNDVYNSYKLQLKGYHKKNFCLFDKKKIITLRCEGNILLLPMAKVNVYRWLITNKITDMLEEKHNMVQQKYYDFRKVSIDRNKKRGKMCTFLRTPMLIHGLTHTKQNIVKKKC